MAWRAAALAASGAEWSWGLRWERNAGVMEDALDAYCDPIPEPQAFLRGIAHRNSKEEYAGQLWNVPRALASKKVHYQTLLEREMFLSNGNAASGAPFHEAYPDAVLGDGWTALTAEAYEATKDAAGINSDDDYVKHILHKHDGEVRHWGPRFWTQVPADFVDRLSRVEVWHYLFAKSSGVRDFLYWFHRNRFDGRLSWQDVNWVLQEEGGETTLLKRVAERGPASVVAGLLGAAEESRHRQGELGRRAHVQAVRGLHPPPQSYMCRRRAIFFSYLQHLRKGDFAAHGRNAHGTAGAFFLKAVDVAEKADPSGFILAREERTRLLLRTQRLSDLLRAEDLDVAWYIDAMREPEHIEYAKVFLQTVRKTLSGEIQRFPEDSEVHRTSIKVSNNFLQKRSAISVFVHSFCSIAAGASRSASAAPVSTPVKARERMLTPPGP